MEFQIKTIADTLKGLVDDYERALDHDEYMTDMSGYTTTLAESYFFKKYKPNVEELELLETLFGPRELAA